MNQTRFAWLLGLFVFAAGCSGGSFFSRSGKVDREKELLTTLNEERRRSQHFEQQYAQAAARLDEAERHVAHADRGGRTSTAWKEFEANRSDRLISTPKSSPIANMTRELPAFRASPDGRSAKLDSELLFGSGSTEIAPGAKSILAQLADSLKSSSHDDYRILVVGHSDTRRPEGNGSATGSAAWRTAAQRAEAVVAFLAQRGVSADRLSVASLGSQAPLASNESDAGRAKNRRVEIYLVDPTMVPWEAQSVAWLGSRRR